jgi:hypothetical protein
LSAFRAYQSAAKAECHAELNVMQSESVMQGWECQAKLRMTCKVRMSCKVWAEDIKCIHKIKWKVECHAKYEWKTFTI